MSVSVDPKKPNFIGLINESVHTSNDRDIGDVFAINKYFLVVKRGFIRPHYYYIPLEKVEGWDGNLLWLLITEDDVTKYERNVFPHPLRYYVKDYKYEKLSHTIPTVNQIPAKFKSNTEDYVSNHMEEIDIYKCDLCDNILNNELEYKNHINSNHL